MTRQLFVFTSAVILAMTLGGCASLGDKPADDAQPEALSAPDVKTMIEEALASDHARRKAEERENADQGIDGVVEGLNAANVNHPVMAMKREIRGCAIQMVLYADTNVAAATDACLRIYNRSPSGGRVNGKPVLMKTQ
jgi:hypothetical protein